MAVTKKAGSFLSPNQMREKMSDKVKETTTEVQKKVTKDYSKFKLEELEGERSNIGSSEAGSGVLTIICHKRCGVRLHISNAIWRALGTPKFVRLIIADGDLIVMKGGEKNVAVKFDRTMDFTEAVAKYKGKITLYASSTVKRLVAEWQLDTETRCSFTLGDYGMTELNGEPAMVIMYEGARRDNEVETDTEDDTEVGTDSDADEEEVDSDIDSDEEEIDEEEVDDDSDEYDEEEE